MQAGDKISFCSYDGRVLDALRFDDNIKNIVSNMTRCCLICHAIIMKNWVGGVKNEQV